MASPTPLLMAYAPLAENLTKALAEYADYADIPEKKRNRTQTIFTIPR
jgi:hypothetical protein